MGNYVDANCTILGVTWLINNRNIWIATLILVAILFISFSNPLNVTSDSSSDKDFFVENSNLIMSGTLGLIIIVAGIMTQATVLLRSVIMMAGVSMAIIIYMFLEGIL